MSQVVWKRIEALIDKDQYKEARQLLFRELKKQPHDHFYLSRLSLTFYEERKYSLALTYAKKAHELVPNCPLVLWEMAGALDMLGKEEEAIDTWKKNLRRGLKRVAFGRCGEGMADARSLFANSRYRIGKAYKDLGNVRMARIYYRNYLKDRGNGAKSIYNKQVATKEYRALDAKRI